MTFSSVHEVKGWLVEFTAHQISENRFLLTYDQAFSRRAFVAIGPHGKGLQLLMRGSERRHSGLVDAMRETISSAAVKPSTSS